MFVSAIEDAAKYTVGIHTIERTFGKTYARAGAATMFFVNEEGVAVTCKHVAQIIPYAEDIAKRFTDFKSKSAALGGGNSFNKKVKELAKQSGFDENSLCELLIQIQGTGNFDSIEYHLHPAYDVAIIKFNNLQNAKRPCAVFINDETVLKQGAVLCRLGFPFPEFTNFIYSSAKDAIAWTTEGVTVTPSFPIEGMITRFLGDQNGVWGIEMSTPGLKGQSGGPLFNSDGAVCGMQSATNHLHLGFDMKNKEIVSNGEKIKVTNQPFLHVGHCIHVSVIKKFLAEKGFRYDLAD